MLRTYHYGLTERSNGPPIPDYGEAALMGQAIHVHHNAKDPEWAMVRALVALAKVLRVPPNLSRHAHQPEVLLLGHLTAAVRTLETAEWLRAVSGPEWGTVMAPKRLPQDVALTVVLTDGERAYNVAGWREAIITHNRSKLTPLGVSIEAANLWPTETIPRELADPKLPSRLVADTIHRAARGRA